MLHLTDRGALRSGSTAAGRWVLGLMGAGVGYGNCLDPSLTPDDANVLSEGIETDAHKIFNLKVNRCLSSFWNCRFPIIWILQFISMVFHYTSNNISNIICDFLMFIGIFFHLYKNCFVLFLTF